MMIGPAIHRRANHLSRLISVSQSRKRAGSDASFLLAHASTLSEALMALIDSPWKMPGAMSQIFSFMARLAH
jgi:hypothetical protein